MTWLIKLLTAISPYIQLISNWYDPKNVEERRKRKVDAELKNLLKQIEILRRTRDEIEGNMKNETNDEKYKEFGVQLGIVTDDINRLLRDKRNIEGK